MSDDDEQGGLNWRAIVIVGCVAVISSVGAMLAVPYIMPAEQGELVIIEAPAGSFKQKPIDSGGTKIDNQKSAMMDMLDDLGGTTNDIETLIPPSDAPELPPVTLEAETGAAEITVKSPTTGSPDQTEQNAASQDAVQDPSSNGYEDNTSLSATVRPKTIVATPKEIPKSKPKPKKSDKPKIIVDGEEPAYMVQLAAFRDANKAAEQAGLLAGKHVKRLEGVALGTMRIDTGENGVFWRIVSEPLPRATADAICGSLKRAGQDCILRKFISPSQ